MGASRNFIRGVKGPPPPPPPPPPPIEKRGLKREENSRKAPTLQKIPLTEKNIAEKHPLLIEKRLPISRK